MSKLWIVHRQARRRDALARLAGLAADEIVIGTPDGAAFVDAAAPAALLIALDDDFELELEFLHRHRARLEGTRRLLLVAPQDVAEAKRLTGAQNDEILDTLPHARDLRAFVLSAVAHRNAEPLAERRDRERIAHRFASWFGELEIPGLMRALDPSLATLPLLVRGAAGSGRSLVARYVELYRLHGGVGPTLRIDAREVVDLESIATRLLTRNASAERPGPAAQKRVRTIWIDEADALAPSVQRGLAEWLRLGTAPGVAVPDTLRWVATAGPAGMRDRLDPLLAAAFAPLGINVPALVDHPEALESFAAQVVAEWTSRVGGPVRRLSPDALDALDAHAWVGDRAAVESLLITALANTSVTSADPLHSEDLGLAGINLHFSGSDTDAREGDTDFAGGRTETIDPEPAPPVAFAQAEVIAPEPLQAPSDATSDFERAFLEGLPEAPPGLTQPGLTQTPLTQTPLTQTPGTYPPDRAADRGDAQLADMNGGILGDPNVDISTEMSESAFDIARGGVRPAEEGGGQSWRRLARSLSHEIRNPLVSIRTFTELLPEHYADESFRERFTELVGRDVAHIDEVVDRLARAASQEKLESTPVDVSALIEGLLDERREAIGERRLLVLRELERDAPIAWADAHSLEIALAGLLDRALAALPERGDLFVATRRIERGPDGAPRLRVLLRHHNPELAGSASRLLGDDPALADVSAANNVIEYVLAETIVEASGGQLTIDATDAQETLILVDLRTPA
jgi:DNA-binding NtrC family response regulator